MESIPEPPDSVTPLTYREARVVLEHIREQYAAGEISLVEWCEQVHDALHQYQLGQALLR